MMGPFRDIKKKTTWRAWVKRPFFMGDWKCRHHHKSRRMALRCGREHADPDRDYVTTEKW